MQADVLIKELLASGNMNEDTTAELTRMLAEFEAGSLDADDAAYVAALHARLTGAPVPEPIESTEAERLEGLTIADWRDRALRAESELEQLKDSITRPA